MLMSRVLGHDHINGCHIRCGVLKNQCYRPIVSVSLFAINQSFRYTAFTDMYHSFQFRPLILISSKLLPNSSSSIAAAPPTSSGHPSSHVSIPCSVHFQDGGPQWWSITVRRGEGFQLLLLLFNQIQHDDLSAAWPSFPTAVLPSLPVTPSAENSRATDCDGNPLQSTTTGKFFVSTRYQEFIVL